MDFKEANEYLESFISYEKATSFDYNEEHFDLERMKKLIDEYCPGYKDLNVVHVAGSKGKGTVSTLVARYLDRIGKKVSLFTSTGKYGITVKSKYHESSGSFKIPPNKAPGMTTSVSFSIDILMRFC